jgi:hypothetical protein
MTVELPSQPCWLPMKDALALRASLFVMEECSLSKGELWLTHGRQYDHAFWHPLGSDVVFITPFTGRLAWDRSKKKGWIMAAKKKFIPPAAQTAGERPAAPDCPDSSFEEAYPIIWGFMSCSKDAAGQARETSTLNFFVDVDGFKVYLHDRQGKRKAFAASKVFSEAVDTLELSLSDGTAIWRQDWQGKAGKRSF